MNIVFTVRPRSKMKRIISLQFWFVSALLGEAFGLSSHTDLTIQRIVGSEPHANSVGNYRDLKIQKYNRTTQIVKGDFEAFIDLDNTVSVGSIGGMVLCNRYLKWSRVSQISFTLYKKTGNQWKTTPFRIAETKFCDWVRDDKIFMEDVIKHTGMPPKGSCPAMPKVSRKFQGNFEFLGEKPNYFEGKVSSGRFSS
jgi:hypothetical protein